MSNVAGFSDLKKNNDGKEGEKEFYTGGNDARGGGSSALVAPFVFFLTLLFFRVGTERVGPNG